MYVCMYVRMHAYDRHLRLADGVGGFVDDCRNRCGRGRVGLHGDFAVGLGVPEYPKSNRSQSVRTALAATARRGVGYAATVASGPGWPVRPLWGCPWASLRLRGWGSRGLAGAPALGDGGEATGPLPAVYRPHSRRRRLLRRSDCRRWPGARGGVAALAGIRRRAPAGADGRPAAPPGMTARARGRD